MKKVFSNVLAVIMIILICGCNQQKEVINNAGSVAAGIKLVKVGVCIHEFGDASMRLYREEIERYLRLKNNEQVQYELTIVDGKSNQEEQINQVDDFISKKYDVLMVNLVNDSGSGSIIKKCRDANIPIVFIDREPNESDLISSNAGDYAGKATFVGADARQAGKLQGEIIAELENKGDISGDGKLQYVMIKGDSNSVDAKYRTALSISSYKEKSGLEVEKLDEQLGMWERGRSEQIVKEDIEKFGKQIEVIFCNDDNMALGAYDAIKAAGRKVGNDIYVVGVGGTVEASQLVTNGALTGTVSNDYVGQSHKAVDIMIDLANGGKAALYNWVDYIKITQ